jgi:hypothetical protein
MEHIQKAHGSNGGGRQSQPIPLYGRSFLENLTATQSDGAQIVRRHCAAMRLKPGAMLAD